MTDETNQSPQSSAEGAREAIARVQAYIDAYEDAPNWGGPTMRPAPPSIDDLKALLTSRPDGVASVGEGVTIKVEKADRNDWPQKTAEEISEIIRKAYIAGANSQKHFNGRLIADNAYDWMMSVGPLVLAPKSGEVGELREAAKKARDQFLFYVGEHTKAAKHEKAETNQMFADLLDAALAKALPTNGGEIAGSALGKAMSSATGISSGPNGYGRMKVVVDGLEPGAEHDLHMLLSSALSAMAPATGEE